MRAQIEALEAENDAAGNVLSVARSILKLFAGAIQGGNAQDEGDQLNMLDATERLLGEAQDRLDGVEVGLRRIRQASGEAPTVVAHRIARRSRKAN